MSIKSSALEKFRRRIAWDDINTQVLISQLECARYEEIGNQKIDADITSDACCVSGNGSAEIVVRENSLFVDYI